jgi:hypothetical protein
MNEDIMVKLIKIVAHSAVLKYNLDCLNQMYEYYS